LKREQDADTWRNQLSHINEKYTKMLEEQRAPKAPTVPDRPGITRPPTVDEWKVNMDGAVKILVDNGVLEADSVALSPDLARVAAALFIEAQNTKQFQANANEIYTGVIVPIVDAAKNEQLYARRNEFLRKLDGIMDSVASIGGYFEGLKDPNTRNQLTTYLSEKVNPEVSRFDSPDAVEFLASQYIAMMKDPLLQAAQAASDTRAATAAVQKRNIQSERPSPGQAKQGPGKNEDIRDLFGRG
jgi:hypothetical protein